MALPLVRFRDRSVWWDGVKKGKAPAVCGYTTSRRGLFHVEKAVEKQTIIRLEKF